MFDWPGLYFSLLFCRGVGVVGGGATDGVVAEHPCPNRDNVLLAQNVLGLPSR